MFVSKFWEHVNSQHFVNHMRRFEAWHKSAYTRSSLWGEATNVLLAELPQAGQWLSFRAESKEQRPLLTELLLALAWGGCFGPGLPERREFDPQDIRFHGTEEFEQLMYQKTPKGSQTFFWSISDEDGLAISKGDERIASFLHRKLQDNDPESDGYFTVSGAAVGLIRKEQIDLYPFPENWKHILMRARKDIRRMTATERAKKQLEFEIKSFVNLVGWKEVNATVERLRP